MIPVIDFVVPWLPYLLLALALCTVLGMYLSLKRDLANQARRSQRVEAMLLRLREATGKHAAGSALAASAPGLSASGTAAVGQSTQTGLGQFLELAVPEAYGFVAPSPRPGMNLSRRVQALRLVRRGEDLGYIAAALGVPRREVELVVRVHQITMQLGTPPPPAPSRSRLAATASSPGSGATFGGGIRSPGLRPAPPATAASTAPGS